MKRLLERLRLCRSIAEELEAHLEDKTTSLRDSGLLLYLAGATFREQGLVDSQGQTVDFFLSETRDREAAKRFLKKASSNPDNLPPHVLARDGLRSYPAAIRELQNRRIDESALSASDQPLCEQPNRIGPPIHQAGG